jgi:hypothetical protein
VGQNILQEEVEIADDTDAVAAGRFVGIIASTPNWYLSAR